MLIQTLTYLEQTLLEEFSSTSPKTLSKIARELGFSDSSAIIYHVKKLVAEGRLIKLKRGSYKTILSEADSFQNVPFFGKGKCGPNGYFLEDSPEYSIPVHSQLLRTSTDKIFALEASGDSMSPSIEDGDLVFARKGDVPESNGIYVVSHNGEILIKKIALIDQNSGKGVLVSINPSYSAITIDPEDFRVIGKVVTIIRRTSY